MELHRSSTDRLPEFRRAGNSARECAYVQFCIAVSGLCRYLSRLGLLFSCFRRSAWAWGAEAWRNCGKTIRGKLAGIRCLGGWVLAGWDRFSLAGLPAVAWLR